MSDLRVPFDEISGGRTTPGQPSPYRAMTWRELVDADYAVERRRAPIRREMNRRLKAGVLEPAPLRLVGREDGR